MSIEIYFDIPSWKSLQNMATKTEIEFDWPKFLDQSVEKCSEK